MPVVLLVHSDQMLKLGRIMAGIQDGIPKVLAPAINRALAKGKTTVKREIRKDYTIKTGDIPVQVGRATRASLKGVVVVNDKMQDLVKFKNTGGTQFGTRRLPLRATVRKGGGGIIKSGFRAIKQLFIREGKSRLPIKKLLTISAPIMASQPSVGPTVIKDMGDTLDKRIDHEIKRVMASAG